MQGSAFTISSLGGIGGTSFTPIVNAPEVAILGATRAAIKPVWNGGEFEPRLMLPLSLSYDHRVIDGAAAARFVVYLVGRALGPAAGAAVSEVSEVRVPDIGDFTDVPVIEIHVAAGDEVAAEDPLVTLESDKATMDVPAPAPGKITQLSVKVGDRVSEGSVLLTLEGSEDGAVADSAASTSETPGCTGNQGVDEPARPLGRERRRPRRPGGGDRLGPGRLHGRLPRRRPRPEDDHDRALRDARRGVPERRLHPVQGAAARRAGGRRGRGDERARDPVRRPEDRPRGAADLEGVGGGQAHRRPRRLAKQRKVEVVHGVAHFTGPNSVQVDDRTITFDNCIIAAGSQAASIPGLPDDPRIIDSTGALDIAEVPERLLVIGCGIIGLEMAAVYDALGSKITCVELFDQLIPGCDPDLVRPLQRADHRALRGGPSLDTRSSRCRPPTTACG